MSVNAGQIDLDMVLNSGDFNNQLSSLAGSLTRAVGIGLSVAAFVSFTKSCLELGSNLEEVQNVVDVTFGSMSSQVNDFAKTSITQLGMSETACKQFMGTYGAMSKGMGFGERAAYSMAESITKLTGDVSSFYNMSAKEASIKLKSIWTGETEPLKDLGVVMTQANLDAYAMANGFGKTTKKMTEMEKVTLRYSFVLNSLKDAQGDFLRTSDSWANQTRILSEQFNALKATLGQGFIVILAPVVKWLNSIILSLQVAANAFKSFAEMVFGQQNTNTAVASVAGNIGNVTDNANAASSAVDGIGDSAKKAAKDVKGLAGIDELNVLNKADDSDDAEMAQPSIDTSAVTGQVNDVDKALNGFIDKVNALKNLFVEGFKVGFGDTNFDGIKKSIDGIKESVKEIFTDPEVSNSAKKFIDAVIYNLGQITGAIASVGVTIAENLLGGIDKYLSQNKDYIKNSLSNLFNVGIDVSNIIGNFATALADIFSVFRGETAKQITADIITIFVNAFLGGVVLAGKFGRDILDTITRPIIENKDKIKEALENTLKPIETLLRSVANFVTDSFIKINQAYDEHIKPMFTALGDGFSSILSNLLNVYNTYIAPVLQSIANKFTELIDKHIVPLRDKFLEFAGGVADGISKLWTGVLVPFINWLVSNVLPIVAPILEGVWKVVITVVEGMIDFITMLMGVFKGLIDFLTGVFTGDWSLAWNGIKEIFGSIVDGIKTIAYTMLKGIEDIFSATWERIKTATSTKWNEITSYLTQKWEEIKTNVSTKFSDIKTYISDTWISVNDTASKKWGEIKTTLSEAWSKITTFSSKTWDDIKKYIADKWNEINQDAPGLWDTIKNTLSGKWTEISTTSQGIWNGIVNFLNTTFSSSWSDAWNGLKNIVVRAFSGLENIVKKPINAIIEMANKLIEGLNSISIDIPDSEIFGDMAGESFGIHIPNIPKLATGGIIDSPTLAMVGEAGKEAVMPLENNTGWITELATKIAGIMGGNSSVSTASNDSGDIIFMLDGNVLGKVAISQLRKMKKQGIVLTDIL